MTERMRHMILRDAPCQPRESVEHEYRWYALDDDRGPVPLQGREAGVERNVVEARRGQPEGLDVAQDEMCEAKLRRISLSLFP
jgi:hypothetical protein